MSDMYDMLERVMGIGKPKSEPPPSTSHNGDLKQFALAFLKRWAKIVPADTPFSHETLLRDKESGRVFKIETTITDVTTASTYTAKES